MIKSSDVIKEARRWVGTPYQHQARVLGVGVDCAGLIVGVGRALGLVDFDYSGYGRLPHRGMLRQICNERFQLLDQTEPGCILLIGFMAGPAEEQHLALLTDEDTIVHAYANAGACVEHRYADVWRARTRQAYKYVGVA